MADDTKFKPPSGFTLDPPPGSASAPATASKPDPNTKFTAPKGFTLDPEPKATPTRPDADDGSGLAGYEGAVTRGLAPVATAAGVGAVAGSVIPGVGTVAGAGLGALAAGGTEAALGIYNIIGPSLGWPHAPTPDEAISRVMDHLGIAKPVTPGQRIVESTVGAAAGTTGLARGAATAAERATSTLGKGIAEHMAEKPVAQATAAAVGGAAGQTAREAGADPYTSWAVSLLASAAAPQARRLVPGMPRPEAVAARDAGYVLPPGEISRQPGVEGQTLASTSGRIKSWQYASERNQAVTNDLALGDLGLPKGTPLTDETFEALRDRAGQVYEEAGNSVPLIFAKRQNPNLPQTGPISPVSPKYPGVMDPQFERDIADLASIGAEARKEFPTLVRIPGIDKLQNGLRDLTTFSPKAGIQLVRFYRAQAKANFMARDQPAKLFLAQAQRRGAQAIEDLMDRQLSVIGQPDVVDRLRQARELIAKSYDVQIATRNGDVDARRIAALRTMNRAGARRSELTGGLRTIADTFNAFPKNLALPTTPTEALSVLDMFAGASAAVSGHVHGLALPFLRPLSRRAMFSPSFQDYQVYGGGWLGDYLGDFGITPPSTWGGSPAAARTAILGAQAGDTQGDLSPYYRDDDAILQGLH